MNIKTSPITKSALLFGWDRTGNTDLFVFPQLNILVGFIFKIKMFNIQFYVEEDAFTNQGVDLTFNLMFSQSIRIKK